MYLVKLELAILQTGSLEFLLTINYFDFFNIAICPAW